MVIEITDKNFKENVEDEEGRILVDFWATWCGPCKKIEPIIEEIADENRSIKVGKLNVDENPITTAKYQIMSIPTLILFKSGKIVTTIRGAQTKEIILSEIDKAVNV